MALAKFQYMKRSHSALSESIYSSSLPKASDLLIHASRNSIREDEKEQEGSHEVGSTSLENERRQPHPPYGYVSDRSSGHSTTATKEVPTLVDDNMLFAMSGLGFGGTEQEREDI
jgi:hypothetical protein